MFKVFAFLKRNAALLSHDEYRVGHVGYHCGQSRRLKNIRGYLVNIWANTAFRDKIGQDRYARWTIDEPEDFLDWWDGFPEVYFDDYESWINALTVEPTRATAEGLVVDPDWSLADGPVLFDPVPERPGEFKPCHLRMHERVLVPVERAEEKAFKVIAFFKRQSGDSASIDRRLLDEYAVIIRRFTRLRGCILNFRDNDQDAAMRGFYGADTWGHSEEGVAHRAAFCEFWDGAIEYHFDTLDDFIVARSALDSELRPLEHALFRSHWFVEVDENLVVMPNRDPAPDFYFR